MESFESLDFFLKAIQSYQSQFPDETKKGEDFLDLLRRVSTNAFKRENRREHFTASAWILSPDKASTLLTHHRKLKCWVQLGGHCDGDTNILRSALREAEEESGIMGFEILGDGIFDMDRHLVPARSDEPEHFHYDIRFCLRAPHMSFQVSPESLELKWISLDDSIFESSGFEESVRRMQAKTVRFYRA